jgi:hypothetical protein
MEPSKEATLKEVMAEVSVADLGPMLKRWLTSIGCLGIFVAAGFLFDAASNATGLKVPGSSILIRVFWFLFAWGMAYEFTSDKSYHTFQAGWYFPRLGWFGSLLLAAYGVGFVYLLIWLFNMEKGAEREIALLTIWLGYLTPFTAFLSVTSLGHSKLMEKRRVEMRVAGNS